MNNRINKIVASISGLVYLTATGYGQLLTFTTATSPFEPGVYNQGWWLGTSGFNSTFNDNILTGYSSGEEHRSFYTFDLTSTVLSGQRVVGAALQIQRFGITTDSEAEVLGFFDVSTDPATLNNNTGGDAAIFEDLGTGKGYGSFLITNGDFFEILEFDLNADAVSDINASVGGFFSVGGRLLTASAVDDFVFGSASGDFAVRLVLQLQSEDSDQDQDGVLDSEDLCPGTPAGVPVEETGCSIDQLCPCEGNPSNHGQYVACIAHQTSRFVQAGLISEAQRRAMIEFAAKSDCGKAKLSPP